MFRLIRSHHGADRESKGNVRSCMVGVRSRVFTYVYERIHLYTYVHIRDNILGKVRDLRPPCICDHFRFIFAISQTMTVDYTPVYRRKLCNA
jgi:hypothetical protein